MSCLHLSKHSLEVGRHTVRPSHEGIPGDAEPVALALRLEAAAPAEEVPRLALHDPVVHADLAARDQHDPGQLGLLIGEGLGMTSESTMSAPRCPRQWCLNNILRPSMLQLTR